MVTSIFYFSSFGLKKETEGEIMNAIEVRSDEKNKVTVEQDYILFPFSSSGMEPAASDKLP